MTRETHAIQLLIKSLPDSLANCQTAWLVSREARATAFIVYGLTSVQVNFSRVPTIFPSPTLITPLDHVVQNTRSVSQDKILWVSNSLSCSSGGSLRMADLVLSGPPMLISYAWSLTMPGKCVRSRWTLRQARTENRKNFLSVARTIWSSALVSSV